MAPSHVGRAFVPRQLFLPIPVASPNIDTIKETKNTYRYDAADGAAVTSLSIQKRALPHGAPSELELRLTTG